MSDTTVRIQLRKIFVLLSVPVISALLSLMVTIKVSAEDISGNINASDLITNEVYFITGNTTININENKTIDSLNISSSRTLTITGTGNYTLTINSTIATYGDLTMESGKVHVGGTVFIVGKNFTLEGGELVVGRVFRAKTVTVNGGKVTVSPNSYGICGENGITITGGEVVSTSVNIGLYSTNGNIDISGGTVSATGNSEYGICSRNGNVSITGGTVIANGPSGNDIYASGSVTISGTADVKNGNNLSLHAITVSSAGNGSASASVSCAVSGADIDLTATPDNGYVFKEWQVSPGTVSITNNSFTMPDENVTVTAVFETVPQNPGGPAPTIVHESKSGSPANYFREVDDKIIEAINSKEARVVKIEGYPALSYHVLEMLKNNPNITLVSEFSYDGLDYRITIPGYAVKLDPSIRLYGPKYLFPKFYMYGTDTIPMVRVYLDKYERPAS